MISCSQIKKGLPLCTDPKNERHLMRGRTRFGGTDQSSRKVFRALHGGLGAGLPPPVPPVGDKGGKGK